MSGLCDKRDLRPHTVLYVKWNQIHLCSWVTFRKTAFSPPNYISLPVLKKPNPNNETTHKQQKDKHSICPAPCQMFLARAFEETAKAVTAKLWLKLYFFNPYSKWGRSKTKLVITFTLSAVPHMTEKHLTAHSGTHLLKITWRGFIAKPTSNFSK